MELVLKPSKMYELVCVYASLKNKKQFSTSLTNLKFPEILRGSWVRLFTEYNK